MHSLLRVIATVALAAALVACDACERDDTARNQQDRDETTAGDEGSALDRDDDSTDISARDDLGTSGAQGGTEAEQRFDHFAMMINHAEVELGRLGERKAQNAEVKQFTPGWDTSVIEQYFRDPRKAGRRRNKMGYI